MREQRIFPASILEQSANQIFSKSSHLSGVIYLTTLFFVVGVLVAINFINIDVNVRASGTIKPKEDHTVITTTSCGYISNCNLYPNKIVQEGDTLFIISSELLHVKVPALQQRQGELEDLISDLTNLTTKSPYSVILKSPMYKQDVLYYIAQWNEADAKRKQAKQAYDRSKKLFDACVIPLSEFESIEAGFNQAENAVRTLTSYQKRQWQSDLTEYKNELRDIETQLSEIDFQNSETIVISPVGGSIQQVQTLFDGSYVTAGQQIAEISPDGEMIAECYVQTKDIGYMKPGMLGKIQISAFNYSEWGMLNAKVDEIFNDVTVSQDGTRSFYKIYCSLDSDHLSLKNGYVGYIKKGMSLNANFTVTKRTAFQLLYDKLDDWLNPNVNQNDNE